MATQQQQRITAPAASHRRAMEEVRLKCDGEMGAHMERATVAAAAFRLSLHSISALAQQTLENREKLVNLKDDLRESDTLLSKALAVTKGKEAKYTSFSEALSSVTTRTEQMKKLVLAQRRKRDECAAVISEQLASLKSSEEKNDSFEAETKKIEEAISWYKKVLGFQAEGGEGVKFTFQKVVMKNLEAEFTFTIRLDNDVYKLVHSDPILEDISGLIQELNRTKNLFKFVRVMRKKFVDSALSGVLPSATSTCQDLSAITISSPPFSVDSRTEMLVTRSDISTQPEDNQFVFPKLDNNSEISNLSPQLASGLRRSPRFKVKK